MQSRLSYRCDNRWEDMSPRGPGRHCDECQTTVIDISRLTRKEALRRTADGACVRIRYDSGGAPIFRTEPTRRGGLVVAAALLGGCAASSDPAASLEPVRFEGAPTSAPLEPVALVDVPAGLAVADLADLGELEETLNGWRHEGGPTLEQIALTESKRRRRQAAAAPPPHQQYLGMMMPADW